MDLTVEGGTVEVLLSDVEIATEDMPGWLVANEGSLTIALDIEVSEPLRREGVARELVNRIENLRKTIRCGNHRPHPHPDRRTGRNQ